MRLMSGCASAISADISAVTTPIHTTTVSEGVTPLIAPTEKSGYTRARRNTPAATIVAAWINALTGVGPSIASGNQTWSGKLTGFAGRAAENQKRDERGAGAKRSQRRIFEAAVTAIVEKQRAAAPVKPEHAEKKSEIADARGDERFFRRGRGAGPIDPEADEEIGGESDQFPANKKKQQTVCDDDAEHRGGEKRKVCKKAGEVFVVGHVADAENKNAKADQSDHDQHRGSERIEHPADSKRLFAKGEPGKIVEPRGIRAFGARAKRRGSREQAQ